MKALALLLSACCFLPDLTAREVEKVALTPAAHMTRAELWFAPAVRNPQAILVLCPGMNGSGESLARDPEWQAFAKRNNLGLVGLSFASAPEDLYGGLGYTFPEQGSGEVLLQGLRQHYGRELPILLYGFSSGAYFTEKFVQWNPKSVMAWCALGTGRYEDNPLQWPPGIVACGEQDRGRYGAALMHFKKGRAAGSNLLWISLPDCGHQWPAELHEFVQTYFEAILHGPKSPQWVDIDSEKDLTVEQASIQPSLSGWIPNRSLVESWKSIHQP